MGHNVYLTGSAGSGKTFLLNQYVKFLKSKGVEPAVTASTGIAATHMNGITIHSWSGLGIKDELGKKDEWALLKKRHLAKRFDSAKVLIIDEVSMLHSFRLDMVDRVCRLFKQNNFPFGGTQVVLCGDFFQLPPISRNGQSADFIDKSKVWNNMNLKVCYLHGQYRHSDEALTKVLNDIRADNAGEHTLEPLRKRYKGSVAGAEKITKLYTHNIDVDAINRRELAKLPGGAKRYEMASRGRRKLTEILKNSCLAPAELILKKEAAVMFVKNNFEAGYVNGTLGRIIDFDQKGMPVVKTLKGKEIIVEPASWTIEEDGQVKAEIRQVPLRLAWAITVHKSQGMTLDAAEVDLSKSFVEGMGYVALSRVRSLAGLKLMGLNKMALKVNKEALELDKKLRSASEAAAAELKTLAYPEKIQKQKEFLRSAVAGKKEKALSTYEETKLLILKKLSISEMALERNLTAGTITSHLEELLSRGENFDLEYLRAGLPPGRFEKIKSAFRKTNDRKLAPVRELLGEDFSYDELRLARLFLEEEK